MAVQFVTVQYQVDTGDLEDSRNVIRQIARELGITEDQVEEINSELNNTQGELRDVQRETSRTESRFAGLGKKIKAALAVTAIAAFAKQAIGLAAEMESLTIQFEQFAGSTEKAKKLLGEVEAFAASTPFQFENLAQAARNMLAFGIAQEDVLPNLRKLGDLAAGSGNDVGELAELFGKAKVQGRLFAEDINQFLERGIPIVKGLAEAMGTTESAVKDLVSKGKVGFGELEGAIESLAGETGQYFGLTEKLSQSTAGRLSTLKDKFAQVARNIGEVLLPIVNVLAGALGVVLDTVNGIVNAFKGLFSAIDADSLGITAKILNAEFKLLGEQFGLNKQQLAEFRKEIEESNFEIKAQGENLDRLAEAYEDYAKKKEDAAAAERAANLETIAQNAALEAQAGSIKALRDQLKTLNAAYESAGTSAERSRILAQIKAIEAQIAALDARNKKLKEGREIEPPDTIQFKPPKVEDSDFDFGEQILNEIEKDIKANPPIPLDADILEIRGDGIAERLASIFEEIDDPFAALGDRWGDFSEIVSRTLADIDAGNLDAIEGAKEIATAGIEALISLGAASAEIIGNLLAASFNKQEAELKAQKESELARFGQTEEAKAQINAKFAAKEEQLRAKKAQQEKRLAVFETIISTAAAIVKALPNIPLSILAAAIGASQLAVIQSQSFAEGVIDLKGPGTGTSDDIPAWLSRGESVMTAKETRQYRPVLDAIRGKKINPVLLNEFVKGNLSLASAGQSMNIAPLMKEFQGLRKDIKNLQIYHTVFDERGVTKFISGQESYYYHLKQAANG